MASACTECGCSCLQCGFSDTKSASLGQEIAKLCKQFNASDSLKHELELMLRDLPDSATKTDGNTKVQENLESYVQQNRRLKESYDEALRKNQELECQVLKMADELQVERRRFDETLAAMTERLVDATENMNTMERDTVKSRRDCALVVQLLRCNQSVDRNFVSEQVNSFPYELKKKLKGELPEFKGIRDGILKPRPANTDANDNKRIFQRSKSISFALPTSDAIDK